MFMIYQWLKTEMLKNSFPCHALQRAMKMSYIFVMCFIECKLVIQLLCGFVLFSPEEIIASF